jgi:hypothetical protein
VFAKTLLAVVAKQEIGGKSNRKIVSSFGERKQKGDASKLDKIQHDDNVNLILHKNDHG